MDLETFDIDENIIGEYEIYSNTGNKQFIDLVMSIIKNEVLINHDNITYAWLFSSYCICNLFIDHKDKLKGILDLTSAEYIALLLIYGSDKKFEEVIPPLLVYENPWLVGFDEDFEDVILYFEPEPWKKFKDFIFKAVYFETIYLDMLYPDRRNKIIKNLINRRETQ